MRKYTPEERIAVFWSRVDNAGGPDACWTWKSHLCEGYGRMRWAGRMVLAHRIAYTLDYGPIADDICVLHRCDNRPCCNPRHLFLGTRLDNNVDRKRKGRNNSHLRRGERNGFSKLTDAQVADIRRIYADGGITQRQLAVKFGVSKQLIGFIITRRLHA